MQTLNAVIVNYLGDIFLVAHAEVEILASTYKAFKSSECCRNSFGDVLYSDTQSQKQARVACIEAVINKW